MKKTTSKLSEYKYKWKYTEDERPCEAACYDCGIPYNSFQDMVIDDDMWELINPTYFKGAGLLCPTCMANRLDCLGLWYENGMFNRKTELGD